MIIEDYVSFEVARLLKEKRFDGECRAFWKDWKGEIRLCSCNRAHMFDYCHNSMLERYNDTEETNIAAPTLQMAMKWLREEHNIFIDISSRFSKNADKDVCFSYSCKKLVDTYKSSYEIGDGEWLNYEEACEAAIKYCLENLI